MKTNSLVAIAVLLGSATNIHAQGGGGGGPGRGGVQVDRAVVAQFDKNGDKRLDVAERQAAREWLATQGNGGGFGGPPGMAGGSGGRGGFPGGGGRGGPGGGRGGLAASSPGATVMPASVKSYPATTSLYDPATLRTVFLTFENADWEAELAAFNNTDVEVPATAVVDGKTYPNVGVHFRGNSSYMAVPAGSKRSLNLTFDFADAKQSLLGYRTLNLLNAMNDVSFVRTTVFSHIIRQFIPAPKTNYMSVVINGENWGVYVNAEQFNKDFLQSNYNTPDGARWKVPGSPGARGGMEYLGDDTAAYKRIYQIKSKNDAKAWEAMIAMFKVLNTTPPEQLEKALAPLLDIDGVLKFIALDIASVNSDGYWTRASDYDIYQDPKGMFHVIPHDMNEALGGEEAARGGGPGGPGGRGAAFPDGPPPGFDTTGMRRGGPPGGFGRGGPGMMGGSVDLDPLVGLNDASKPLRAKLLAVPALRKKYLGYVREIADKWMDWKTIGPVAEQYHALIATAVQADTKKLYSTEGFRTSLTEGDASVKGFFERRRAFLLKRLSEL